MPAKPSQRCGHLASFRCAAKFGHKRSNSAHWPHWRGSRMTQTGHRLTLPRLAPTSPLRYTHAVGRYRTGARPLACGSSAVYHRRRRSSICLENNNKQNHWGDGHAVSFDIYERELPCARRIAGGRGPCSGTDHRTCADRRSLNCQQSDWLAATFKPDKIISSVLITSNFTSCISA
jgi:hypothetical protein